MIEVDHRVLYNNNNKKTQRNDTYTRAASGERKAFWEAPEVAHENVLCPSLGAFIIFFFFSSDDHNLSHYLENRQLSVKTKHEKTSVVSGGAKKMFTSMRVRLLQGTEETPFLAKV